MSNFNSYGRKVDEIAKAAFDEYRKAEAAYKRAEEQANTYPQRGGFVDPQYAAKSARAHADLIEAKEAFAAAKRKFASHTSEITAIRQELVTKIKDQYAADPEKLDNNTLELVKSGILKPYEYSKLYNEARAAGNYTMARIIAKYASDAAADIGKKYGDNDERARELRAISYNESQNDGDEILQDFDILREVYTRAVNDPAMIDAWEQLTADTIANM